MHKLKREVVLKVYGSDKPCPSCIQSPPSKDTYEWLMAAITRKFPEQTLEMNYIDIDRPSSEESAFIEQIWEDELIYPIVMINNEIITEGNPSLKPIFKELERLGYTSSPNP